MSPDAASMPPPEMVSYNVHWFRGTVFQVFVMGGVYFCAPGMYNALSSLGAGGLATPWYANATAAAGLVFMAVLCIIGGVIVSKIGVRLALFISTFGDIIYASSLYLNSKNGTQWFLLFGSIISGATDGLLYAIEGPIITAYPEPDRRGRILSLWAFMHNAAKIVGGSIIFSLNSHRTTKGAVSLQTYLAIIGVMCIGPFLSLLLSKPEKVQRRDGVKITFRKMSWSRTLYEFYKVVSSRSVLLLCPWFFTQWLYNAYVGTLQTQFFSVRTRALCSLLVPWGDIFGAFIMGHFLDHAKRLSINQRARFTWAFLMALTLGLWVWAAIISKQLEGHPSGIDWSSGAIFGKIFGLIFMFEFTSMATQTLLYWLIGHMYSDFLVLLYMVGTLRGMECIGQAVAYGIKSKNLSDWVAIGLNIGLIVFSMPFAWMVIRKIGVERFEEIDFGSANAVDEKKDVTDVEVKERDLEDDSVTDSKSLQ